MSALVEVMRQNKQLNKAFIILIIGHYSRLTEDAGSPSTRQTESSSYGARCLAYKKVRYNPRALFPNRNTYLNFACKVIPPGRAFLQRIINLTPGSPLN